MMSISNKEEKIFFRLCDYNSLNVNFDDNLWDYDMNMFNDLYDLKKNYEFYKKSFHDDFDSSLKEFLYRKQNVLKCISGGLNGGKKFIDTFKPGLKLPKNMEKLYYSDNLYLPGHTFISIDIKDCTYQVLEYFDIFNGKNMHDVFLQIDPSETFFKSKNFRVELSDYIKLYDVMIKYNIIMLSNIVSGDSDLIKMINFFKCKFIRMVNDELVWDITGHENDFKPFIGNQIISGVDVHVKMFNYSHLEFEYEDRPLFLNYKTFDDGKIKLQARYSPFSKQVLKAIRKEDFNEKDLYYPEYGKTSKLNEYIKNVKELNEEELIELMKTIKETD